MSEINAAFGLLQLRTIDQEIARRKAVDATYREQLSQVDGIRCPAENAQTTSNYGYFPILVESAYPLSRDGLYQKLREQQMYARRYFYPLISDFPMYRAFPSANRSNLTFAANAADKVLCLPIYPGLQDIDQWRVIDAIRGRS